MSDASPAPAVDGDGWWTGPVAALGRARLAIGLAALGGVVHVWNMAGSPGAFDDEGTYVAQAWAVQHWGALAHYTYWYDHPPLGWIQIALWSVMTGGRSGGVGAVLAARPLMLVAQVVSCLLLYVLGRRLGMGRPGVVLTVSAFALSPLAVMFHRYVLLDNVATPWLVGAFVLAASPRRSLGAAAGAAACMACAVLSKETTLVLLPALVWQLWSASDRRSRHFAMAIFGGLFSALMAAYPLLAALKNELVPGEGHVSLLGSVQWQLFGRESSGSVLAGGSDARGLVELWLRVDAWLLVAGVLLVPLALALHRLRPVAFGLLVQLLMPLRPGYLPYPYVIAVLPFAALVFGGVVDDRWRRWQATAGPARPLTGPRSVLTGRGAVVVAMAVVVALVVPGWARGLHDLATADRTAALGQAVDWLAARAQRDDIIVVDDTVWVDLVERGHPADKVIWFYKVDLDPAVKLPDGWRSIRYVVLGDSVVTARGLPTVQAAIEHSHTVASFGSGPDRLSVRRIGPDPEGETPTLIPPGMDGGRPGEEARGSGPAPVQSSTTLAGGPVVEAAAVPAPLPFPMPVAGVGAGGAGPAAMNRGRDRATGPAARSRPGQDSPVRTPVPGRGGVAVPGPGPGRASAPPPPPPAGAGGFAITAAGVDQPALPAPRRDRRGSGPRPRRPAPTRPSTKPSVNVIINGVEACCCGDHTRRAGLCSVRWTR